MNAVKIFQTSVHNLSSRQAVEAAESFIQNRSSAQVVTLNTEMILRAEKDSSFLSIINEANLRIADSAGVVAALKILGTPVKEKIPGIDYFRMLLKMLSEKQGSVFLFGGRPGVAQQAADVILNQYPGIRIAGVSDGYNYSSEDVCREINRTEPDVVAVCLGSPKQEIWINQHSKNLHSGVLVGLGGTFDVIAGESKLAPQAWRDHGLEWLYRLIHDPKRIGRMIKLPQIIFMAVFGRLESLWKKEN